MGQKAYGRFGPLTLPMGGGGINVNTYNIFVTHLSKPVYLAYQGMCPFPLHMCFYFKCNFRRLIDNTYIAKGRVFVILEWPRHHV